MSRYRGPRLKKIRHLGALPGLTRKTPKSRSNSINKFHSGKKQQYRIHLRSMPHFIGKPKVFLFHSISLPSTSYHLISIPLVLLT